MSVEQSGVRRQRRESQYFLRDLELTLDPPHITVGDGRTGVKGLGRRIRKVGMVSCAKITGRVGIYRRDWWLAYSSVDVPMRRYM
jgi:hypothetical protein